MEEIKRHCGVVRESLRGDIRPIAEGHAVLRHELQSQREEMKDEDALRFHVGGIYRGVRCGER